jgi:pyrophosphatase PpaX
VTGTDVTNHKPDPEGIFLALNNLGIRSKNVIMIGDTAPDIEAGKNAGVKTIGVTYGFYGRKVTECNPDYVINNFSEIRERAHSALPITL